MNECYTFDVSLFARPDDLPHVEPVTLRGVALTPFDSTALARGPRFSVTFEEAAAALAAVDRVDVEPDGYFVWTREKDGARWQVDGHLFDRDERLWRVDLRGSCPAHRFDAMLRCAGWPGLDIVFQLVREGVTLSEADFRRWAGAMES